MSTERWKPSVTVAAVIEREGRYLLVEEMTPEGLRLNNPAGHLDPGEGLAAAAAREALEETACPFEPQALVGVYLARLRREATGEDITYLRFAFCGTVGEPIPGRALDHPVVRTLWLTLAEIRASQARHRSPLLLQCVEDHAAGRRFPLELLHAHPSLQDLPLKV
ncbi:MAG: NUDIX hydrolase [Vitreoscilla sp.]|nr:NUDIX hydrolase [Burkholderiales bacterium]MBP6338476.1 NUDIX hydrolase [Vitreoscilla sp.]